MKLKKSLERFHDENRYFIPLLFIAFILMVTGAFYSGPVILNFDVLFEHPLLFQGDAVIQAVTLRPDWTFSIEVLSNKDISLSVFNLGGELVARSNTRFLEFSPGFLDLYFVQVHGTDYAIFDFNYTKRGMAPYPTPYLFFASGLLLFLGVMVYYLLEPWGFKFKRKLERLDAVFYPVVFLMSSIILWVFRDSLIWFMPKSLLNYVLMIIFSLVVIAACSFVISALFRGDKLFMKSKKYKKFFKVFFGFLLAYALVFLTVLLDYSGLSSQVGLLVKLAVLGFLILFYVKFNERTALLIYLFTWLTSELIKLLAYSIGVPVVFDTFLTNPSPVGMIPLLFVLEGFMVLAVYFLVKGYFAKNRAKAVSYGLYASIFVQAFMQVFSGSSLI
ncbi:hypothetical protein GF352_04790 [archaeon]|nr:hypothetical protein [archaeon]